MKVGIYILITPYIEIRFCKYHETERKKLNPHANTPAAVQMKEINPKYENTRKIHRLLTNQNP
jgi:hypothetical protein